MADGKYYITTPIYYVNDVPHIGHAYTTVLADVLARYHRLLGVKTFFLTGTDEHGQKVEQAAGKAGISPREHADRTVVPFQELWKRLDITHDDFIRTTEQRHKTVVQRILQDLYDRDEIYRDEYEGWYCVPCERYYTEKDLVDGTCPECHREVSPLKEAAYFFRMGKRQQWLIDYIEANPTFIQPDFRRNETLGFLRSGALRDLCISRPKQRLSWGIELPFDKDYVTYVWFDALINYLTGPGYLHEDKGFRTWWPASCHLIGKDIITTHTVYWPTMLDAIGLPQPEMIYAHGWWNVEGVKMSKSLGNVVNPMDMLEKYGVDAFRYFLIASMTMGQDASFSEDLFVSRFNSELANDLGNLLSRVLNMLNRYHDGILPDVAGTGPDGPEEQALWTTVQEAVAGVASAVDTMQLDKGVAQALEAVRATNKYLELRQPWTQAKAEDKRPLLITLYTAAEALRVEAALLYPVMPGKMGELRSALGLPASDPLDADLRRWGVLAGGKRVSKPGALFPRIQREEDTAPVDAPNAKPTEKPAKAGVADDASTGLITYDDFAKLRLRTAKIMAAEKIEGTTKLLRLEVMSGDERRQIVAGIAQYYDTDDLIGKSIVIVANLKPAKIRGVESQGMLLAASKGESLKLITVDGELSSGASVQ
jgi:methionyl-tRNA synthetase